MTALQTAHATTKATARCQIFEAGAQFACEDICCVRQIPSLAHTCAAMGRQHRQLLESCTGVHCLAWGTDHAKPNENNNPNISASCHEAFRFNIKLRPQWASPRCCRPARCRRTGCRTPWQWPAVRTRVGSTLSISADTKVQKLACDCGRRRSDVPAKGNALGPPPIEHGNLR